MAAAAFGVGIVTSPSLLRPADAAVLLGVSVRQLQRLTDAGMPCVPVGARSVRFNAAACLEWLQANHDTLVERLGARRPVVASRSASPSAAAAFAAASHKVSLRVMPSQRDPD